MTHITSLVLLEMVKYALQTSDTAMYAGRVRNSIYLNYKEIHNTITYLAYEQLYLNNKINKVQFHGYSKTRFKNRNLRRYSEGNDVHHGTSHYANSNM